MKNITIFLFTIFILNSCSTIPNGTAREVYYIESDGASLPVIIEGPNTDKVILFVHGGPALSSSLYYYMPFFQKLTDHYRVVYWDQRGAGGSRGHITSESITIPQFIKDMDVVYQSVLAKYPKSEIYVLGHSYGGMVGGAYITQFSDKIKASIFISPAFNVDSLAKEVSPLMLKYITDLLSSGSLSSSDKNLWEKGKEFYSSKPAITAKDFVEHTKWTGYRDARLGLNQDATFTKEILPVFLSDNILETTDFILERIILLDHLQKNGEAQRELSIDPVLNLGMVKHPVFVAVGSLDFVVPPNTSTKGFNSLNNGTPTSTSKLFTMPNTTHTSFLQPIKDDLFTEVTNFISLN